MDGTGAVAVGKIHGFLSPGTMDPGSDAFATKFDVSGNIVWTIQFGTEGFFDNALDAALEDEDVYIVGNTTGALAGSPSAGSQDGYLMRLRGN